ncbi:UBE2D [Mytilus coruscus]|uniref:UBE2D n=1 Tax=Mytilus coruscus TaxID=42192 RepID=A0A6J8DZG1_MYTCO|nr:UBE2D [Mytilus coruscus]
MEREICVEGEKPRCGILKKLNTVLLCIKSLLTSPKPDDPLVPDAAKLYKLDKKKTIKQRQNGHENMPCDMCSTEIEHLEISKDPPPGCSAGPLDDNIFIWEAMVAGPYDDRKSPYAGGVFFLQMTIPNDYPYRPPTVKFLTEIYHPYVEHSSGKLSLNILSSRWSPDLTISKLLICIKTLLDSPDPNGGKLSLSDSFTYNRTAADWTRKYADVR